MSNKVENYRSCVRMYSSMAKQANPARVRPDLRAASEKAAFCDSVHDMLNWILRSAAGTSLRPTYPPLGPIFGVGLYPGV